MGTKGGPRTDDRGRVLVVGASPRWPGSTRRATRPPAPSAPATAGGRCHPRARPRLRLPGRRGGGGRPVTGRRRAPVTGPGSCRSCSTTTPGPCPRVLRGRSATPPRPRRRFPGPATPVAPSTSSRSRRCGDVSGRWPAARSRSPRSATASSTTRRACPSSSSAVPRTRSAPSTTPVCTGVRVCARQPGRVDELRCPFHGFTWNLDGSFAGMPCPWDFPHVDPSSFCLPEARVGTWGGFVFVTVVTATAEPRGVTSRSSPSTSRRGTSAERYLAAHVVRVVPCNWKVALEAFIESYHTVAVHPQLLKTSGDTQTQYDVYPGVRHVNRMITPVGIASEHVEAEVAEQDILDAMFLTKDDAAPWSPTVPAPARCWPTAPVASWPSGPAVTTRRSPTARRSTPSSTSCSPTSCPGPGYTTPLVYRFRPHDDDHTAAVMDVMLLEPVPVSGPRPPAAPTRHLAPGERWADAPELGYLGRILDQDTATLGRVQQRPRVARRRPTSPWRATRRAGSAISTPPSASTSRRDRARRRGAGARSRVWEADDSEPVLDTTVASILARRGPPRPDTIALVAGDRRPRRPPALDLRRAPRRRRPRRPGLGGALRARRASGRLATEHPRVARPHLRGGHWPGWSSCP